MSEATRPADSAPTVPVAIEATFRSGSLTAISVLAGFSLSFLNRWAALPGEWHQIDLVAVAFISTGIVLQIVALAELFHPLADLRELSARDPLLPRRAWPGRGGHGHRHLRRHSRLRPAYAIGDAGSKLDIGQLLMRFGAESEALRDNLVSLIIREALPADAGLIFDLVSELADYGRLARASTRRER